MSSFPPPRAETARPHSTPPKPFRVAKRAVVGVRQEPAPLRSVAVDDHFANSGHGSIVAVTP